MKLHSIWNRKHCRWCGNEYYAQKPHGKDGFHSKACRQAHYRAYKRYVTAKKDRLLSRMVS